MLHGKKGFERIVWAFKNVLNYSLAWLFHDFASECEQRRAMAFLKSFDYKVADCSTAAKDAPIAKHHPVTKEISPQQKITKRVRVPNLRARHSSESDDDFKDWAFEIYEWLGLVTLESPRVLLGDSIDPFLSRYQVPDDNSGEAINMVTLTWIGFVPAPWIRDLFLLLSR